MASASAFTRAARDSASLDDAEATFVFVSAALDDNALWAASLMVGVDSIVLGCYVCI
jgi:hypothetical protein